MLRPLYGVPLLLGLVLLHSRLSLDNFETLQGFVAFMSAFGAGVVATKLSPSRRKAEPDISAH